MRPQFEDGREAGQAAHLCGQWSGESPESIFWSIPSYLDLSSRRAGLNRGWFQFDRHTIREHGRKHGRRGGQVGEGSKEGALPVATQVVLVVLVNYTLIWFSPFSSIWAFLSS